MKKRYKILLLVSVIGVMLSSTISFAGLNYSEKVQAKLSNAVVLHIGNPKAFVKNSETQVGDQNKEVVPFIKDGRTLVPIRFISENFGAKVEWNETEKKAQVILDDVAISFVIGKNEMCITRLKYDGLDEILKLEVPAQIVNDRTFLPLRALVEALGKQVFWDDRGLIVISDNENIFNANTEKDLIDELQASFITKVETTTIPKELLNINSYHPIVFATNYNDENTISNANVIGGSNNGKWFDVEDFDIRCEGKAVTIDDFFSSSDLQGKEVYIPLVNGNESFKFYSFNKLIAETKVENKLPKMSVSEASCQEFIDVEVRPFKTDEDLLIGINGDWNPLPSLPKAIDGQYAFSVDMDGDGEDEVVKIVGENEKVLDDNGDIIPGMIKKNIVIEKGDQNTVIENFLYQDSSENFEFFVLDLNGDGKLEVVTYLSSTAGFLTVFELNDGKANAVLGMDLGE